MVAKVKRRAAPSTKQPSCDKKKSAPVVLPAWAKDIRNRMRLNPCTPRRASLSDMSGRRLVRELNGPLTALLLYMGEIKQHSHALARSDADKSYLKKIVENALEQTERVCAMVGRVAEAEGLAPPSAGNPAGRHGRTRRGKPAQNAVNGLTHREREVLTLIGEGHTNKQGALEMRISPRTFESHRAEVMRKLGARNTADLVRAALHLATADQ
jgi:DNA-binding NarL/FixJ family response regulator